jgi:chromosome segregation ATPase
MTESVADISGSGGLSQGSFTADTRYHDLRDYQRRDSDLQRENLKLKMALINRENQFSRLLVDGNIDPKTIAEFITSAKQLDDVHAQIRELKAEVQGANRTVQELEKQREQNAALEHDLRGQIATLTAKLDILENRQPTSPGSKRLGDIEYENAQLKRECAIQDSRNTDLTLENLALKSQLDDFTNDGKRTDSETARIRGQLEKAQAVLSKTQAEKKGLEDKVDLLSRQLADRNAAASRDQKQIQSYEKNLRASKHEIAELSESLRTRALHFERLISQTSSEFAGKIQQTGKRVAKLQKQHQSYAQKLKASKSSQYTALDKITGLCAQFAQLTSAVPSAEELLSDPVAMEFFIGRVQTAADLRDSKVKKLEQVVHSAHKSRRARPSGLSPSVSSAIQNVHNTVSDIKSSLHKDHTQLMRVLTPDTDEIDLDFP